MSIKDGGCFAKMNYMAKPILFGKTRLLVKYYCDFLYMYFILI